MDFGLLGEYGFQAAISLTAIMIASGGMVLGLAYAMDDRRLKEAARSELYQSVVNAVLIGVLVSAIAGGGFLTSTINSAVGSANATFSCPELMSSNYAICFADNYLVGTSAYTILGKSYVPLLPMVTGFMAAVFGLNVVLGAASGVTLNLPLVSLSLSGAITPFLKETQYILELLTTLSISISVQAAVLYFISLTAASMILPAGLLLRAFRASRRLGGFLVAVAIGMYIVFPMSYLFNAVMVSSYSSSLNSSAVNIITIKADGLDSQLLGVSPMPANRTGSFLSGISSAVSSVLSSLSSAISSVLAIVAGLIVQVFILPIFSLVITGVSIRELAGLLGSEAFFGRLNLL